MKLLKQPRKPRFNPMLVRKLQNPKYESWKTFVRGVDSVAGHA